MSIDLKDDPNHKYIVFWELKKSLFCNNKKEKSIFKFAKRGIKLVFIDNISEIHNFTFCGKRIKFNDLEYPEFKSFYILFNTMNFESEQFINYYTYDMHFYKMKSFKHNFLVYLAQSFGANIISWSSEIQKNKNIKNNVGIDVGYADIGLSQTYNKENEKIMNVNHSQELEYGNYGSEIYFNLTKNNVPWVSKEIINYILNNQKELNLTTEMVNKIKKSISEKILEQFLNSSDYYTYAFYTSEPYLMDFVRKRIDGMLSISHEMLYSDSNKTVLDYYTSIGYKIFGKASIKYNYEELTNITEKTTYKVSFYPNEELEEITLELMLTEKSLKQLIVEQEHLLNLKREIITNYLKIDINIELDRTYFLLKYKKLYEYMKKNKEKYSNIDVEDKIGEIIKYILIYFKNILNNSDIENWINAVPRDFINIIAENIFNSLNVTSEFTYLLSFINSSKFYLDENEKFARINIIRTYRYYDENDDKYKKMLEQISCYKEFKEKKFSENSTISTDDNSSVNSVNYMSNHKKKRINSSTIKKNAEKNQRIFIQKNEYGVFNSKHNSDNISELSPTNTNNLSCSPIPELTKTMTPSFRVAQQQSNYSCFQEASPCFQEASPCFQEASPIITSFVQKQINTPKISYRVVSPPKNKYLDLNELSDPENSLNYSKTDTPDTPNSINLEFNSDILNNGNEKEIINDGDIIMLEKAIILYEKNRKKDAINAFKVNTFINKRDRESFLKMSEQLKLMLIKKTFKNLKVNFNKSKEFYKIAVKYHKDTLQRKILLKLNKYIKERKIKKVLLQKKYKTNMDCVIRTINKFDKITSIELVKLENQNDFGNCEGEYLRKIYLINGRNIFANINKNRMIFWNGTNWIITSYDDLTQLLVKNKSKLDIGGYHSNINGDVPLAASNWNCYYVKYN